MIIFRQEKRKNTKLSNLFSGEEIFVWDANLTKAVCPGIIIYVRCSKDENGKYISSGSQNNFLPELVFEFMRY